MTSNYPEGVTGFEPQIAGAEETTLPGKCNAEAHDVAPAYMVRSILIDLHELQDLAAALEAVQTISEYSEEPCGFEGDVEARRIPGAWLWVCPKCGTAQMIEDKDKK